MREKYISMQQDPVSTNSEQRSTDLQYAARFVPHSTITLNVNHLDGDRNPCFENRVDTQSGCLHESEAVPTEEQALSLLSQIRQSFTWEKFFFAFFFGLLPTGLDVATDVNFALTQEADGELTTAGFSYMFICFPVIFTIFIPSLVTKIQKLWSNIAETTLSSILQLITICLTCVAADSAMIFGFVNHPLVFKYPAFVSSFFILGVKIVALLVHTPHVTELSLKVSSAESSYEAPAQLLFLLHNWLSGGQMHLSTMVTSILVIAKVGAENILIKGEEDKMKDKSFLEKVALLARFMPLTALTALFRIGSASAFLYHVHRLLPFTPTAATYIICFCICFCIMTLLLTLLTILRIWVATLRQLNLVELALGLANEFTTVSVWGKLGREGSKGLQLGIATYHLLLNCTYLSWQLAEATKTEQTLGVSDDYIRFHTNTIFSSGEPLYQNLLSSLHCRSLLRTSILSSHCVPAILF